MLAQLSFFVNYHDIARSVLMLLFNVCWRPALDDHAGSVRHTVMSLLLSVFWFVCLFVAANCSRDNVCAHCRLGGEEQECACMPGGGRLR